MIKFQDMTPEVYYNKSRDFLFIGRLFDLVLDYVKTNQELINTLPIGEDFDLGLIDLLSMTLGFKLKHYYNIKQLTALCSVFSYLLRNKGTKKSIEILCNTLSLADGVTLRPIIDIKDGIVTIIVSNKLSDLTLLRDVLDYILPAGLSCHIIKGEIIEHNSMTTTYYQPDDVNNIVVNAGQTSMVVDPNNIPTPGEDYDKYIGVMSASAIVKPTVADTPYIKPATTTPTTTTGGNG